MEALRNLKLVEAARTEARNIVTADLELANHPEIKTRIDAQDKIHFE
jgi:hypothetical protein